jgi:hypothetical protein
MEFSGKINAPAALLHTKYPHKLLVIQREKAT